VFRAASLKQRPHCAKLFAVAATEDEPGDVQFASGIGDTLDRTIA
jgi:hypothetical protein